MTAAEQALARACARHNESDRINCTWLGSSSTAKAFRLTLQPLARFPLLGQQQAARFTVAGASGPVYLLAALNWFRRIV